MKTRVLVLASVLSLSFAVVGCGDKAAEKTDDKASDKKEQKDDKKDTKGDAKKDDAKKDDTGKKDDAKKDTVAASSGSAASHLPAECDLALHVDLAKVVAHPLIAKELIPVLDEMIATPAPKDEKFKAFQAFVKENGFDIKKSLKDAALCMTNLDAGKPDVAMILAGDFKPETIVASIEKNRTPSNKTPIIDIDGRKALSDAKFTMGQLADGSLGISDKAETWKGLNATGDSATSKFKLDLGKEIALSIPDGVIKKAIEKNPPRKGADELKQIKTLAGFVDLTGYKSEFRLGCESADAANKINAYIVVAKSEFEKQAPPSAAEALKSLKTRVEGNDVIIEATIPQAALEDSVKMMKATLEKEKAKL